VNRRGPDIETVMHLLLLAFALGVVVAIWAALEILTRDLLAHGGVR
jgi:uncharacterized membrane protein